MSAEEGVVGATIAHGRIPRLNNLAELDLGQNALFGQIPKKILRLLLPGDAPSGPEPALRKHTRPLREATGSELRGWEEEAAAMVLMTSRRRSGSTEKGVSMGERLRRQYGAEASDVQQQDRVGDLGLSKVKCQTLISGGVRGTLPWMAPELLNGSSSLVSEKVDVFSFGIVMWELLTGEEPYADLHYGAIIGGIVNNTLRPPIPESCDPEWRSLLESCWSAEPSERPSFTEIANKLRAMAASIPQKGQVQAQTSAPAHPQK
ncbi:hypothetical protein Taro_048650 [Colocasia esculenta]|uniref:Protein kinase domain-containing protein n=1 Tax=Colocasia esculenta TaxID=4460 RepID=A0A843X8Q3_COLES|nr:hypothetical protein [Colocasia esculenta]